MLVQYAYGEEIAAFVIARAGRGEDLVPFTGQSAALVHDILPAGEIVRRVVEEAEAALESAGSG